MLSDARGQLRAALRELDDYATSRPIEELRRRADNSGRRRRVQAPMVLSALDPSFRAQELAYVTDQIASNIDFAVAASRRSWWERLLGRQPAGFTGPLTAARERALAHAVPSSSWLHNSLRGAMGLALAVLVADLTSVQHGFWVVFGTLAVLRSNALSTGENVLPSATRHDRWIRCRRCAGGADRDQHNACSGCCSVRRPVRRAGAFGDLLRRRAGGVHGDTAGLVQPARPGRLDARTGPDRGRRDRQRREPRSSGCCSGPAARGRSSVARSAVRTSTARAT